MIGPTSEHAFGLGDVEDWAECIETPETERAAAELAARIAELRERLGVVIEDCMAVVLCGEERFEDVRRD